jgi:hexosaminidase
VEEGPGSGLSPGSVFRLVVTGVWSPRLEAALERMRIPAARRGEGQNSAVPLVIDCGALSGKVPGPGDAEDYRLEVSGQEVRIAAPQEWGILHGLTTLAQMLLPGTGVGAVCIEDGPRYAWRGLLLDVARHFIPLPVLLRTLEGMALCKLNVLHLHLTDDQAFRFPSRAFPKLAADQAYSLADLAQVIEFAAQRGIRVVPELDMPGHTASWLRAYPQWGAGNPQPSRRFGVHPECLDPSNPEVFAAVGILLSELAEVFPDPWVHVGGDEVHPAWWTGSARVQRYMEEHGIPDVAGLHAHFNGRVVALAEALGKRVIAWDEVLHPALPASVVIQSWRGATARDRALEAGHDCVISANYYLDLFFPADVHYRFDPEAPETQLTALEDQLAEDPRLAHVAAGMAWTRHWRDAEAHGTSAPAARRGSVMGAEACLWSELVDGNTLDVRLWTRLPALAERFWSSADRRDSQDMQRRLEAALESLRRVADIDVAAQSRDLLRRAGLQSAWAPLAAVLEPVKWYGRLLGEEALAARIRGTEMPQARPYDADTPLNRVVDGLFPESPEVRRIEGLCEAAAAGDLTARRALEGLAVSWRALPAAGAGPAELEPLAARLKGVGELLLDVMAGRLRSAIAVQRLAEADAPAGEYLLAVVPCLRRWLPALAGVSRPGRRR